MNITTTTIGQLIAHYSCCYTSYTPHDICLVSSKKSHISTPCSFVYIYMTWPVNAACSRGHYNHWPLDITTQGLYYNCRIVLKEYILGPTRFTYFLLILNQHVRMSIYRSKSPSGLVTIKNPQQRQNAKDNT